MSERDRQRDARRATRDRSDDGPGTGEERERAEDAAAGARDVRSEGYGPDTNDARPAEEAVADAQDQRTGVEGSADPTLSEEPDAEVQTEVEILRGELAKLQEELERAKDEGERHRERALRARADLENVRRRAASEEGRAREAGLDSAVLPVLSVYDDLRRALEAAEQGDPEAIVPGVRAVMEGLERNLERLEIRRIGQAGERFDPDLHEALTSVPSEDPGRAGTIAEVFEAGFVRGDRLVRPARVVVYQEASSA